MTQSIAYKAVESQLKRLSDTYLSFSVRPTGNYTKKELSAGGAYTLFAHAEFEEFLESWAHKIVLRAEDKWKLGKASKALLHLCTFYEAAPVSTSIPAKDIWSQPVVKAILSHKLTINNNHGVREENICRLFIPLGFDVRTIDPILLGDLNTFSSLRGAHAHKSHKTQLSQIFDPFDRKLKASSISTLLKALDAQLNSYMKMC